MPIVAAASLLPGATSPAPLEVAIAGLRSARGVIRVCVTADPVHFPDCTGDAAAYRLTVPASDRALRVDGLPEGEYAIALFHDENGNGRIDTRFGIPIEGVGFSNNPRLYFGPPRFATARFALGGAPVAETVRVRYFL